MATFISLVQFTDKGIHAAKETTRRLADWAAKVQPKGVTIKEMYWTLGPMTRYASSRHQTMKRQRACCCPRISWATSGHRRCVLSRVSRWRRFSLRSPDRSESEVLQLGPGCEPGGSTCLLNHFPTKRTCVAASRARPPKHNGRGNKDRRIGSDDNTDKEGEREVV
jgi:hypothetical protein